MARHKSVAYYQQQLDYAKKKAAYKRPAREDGQAVRRQAKSPYTYNATSAIAPADAKFTIQVSDNAVEFFTKAGLNLTDPGIEPLPPRGFTPSQVHAMVADANPQTVKAKASGRPYIHYGKGTVGSKSQYTYTAAITATTDTGLRTTYEAIYNAKKSALGGSYGRMWFTPEDYPVAFSG